MIFHGLFVGVDRYQSPSIKFLSSAVRDATALHALFADGFGGEPTLLTDADATRDSIVAELQRIASVSTADDLVVVGFSGHGSTTHELVPYDADPLCLTETALPLDQLAKLLNDIKAATLLCILDCCFSGGVEAKVLIAPTHPRDLASEAIPLEQIAGRGRIILVASGPNERAYEDNALGHGFLTYYFLQAIQGAPEVLTAGKINLHKLLDHVIRRVVDASAARRQDQHPGFRGSVDGIVSWPILKPGPRYAYAFPERVRQPATTDVHSLEAFGLPDALLDAWATAIPGLNDLQLAAINEYGVLDGENLLVTAPTSSGKTMVGELAALQRALDRRRAVFLLPLRALANDKYREFTDKYGPLGIVTIRSTGEVSDDNSAFVAGRYDVCLTTYETFTRMALANPHLLRQVGTIVVDEIQTIVDPQRGPNLEFVLTLIKSRRAEGIAPQIICLSAVIGDSGGLERWLDGRQLRHTTRPVPLVEGVLSRSGRYRFVGTDGSVGSEHIITPRWTGTNSSQDLVTPLVQKLVNEGKQVIVFRVQKSQTISCAEDLAAHLALPAAQDALDSLPVSDPSVSSQRLHRTLAAGVGFHNSDLTREERRVLEEEFRNDGTKLRVLVATTTLAMGINTPASAVVIDGLMHPRNVPYTVAEYKNMVGRAGRLGYSERGESYIIESFGLDESRAWTGYVSGTPEDIRSVFMNQAEDRRTLILRVLAALGRPSADGKVATDSLVSFLESSYGVFQQRQATSSWAWSRQDIRALLDNLAHHQLIEMVEGDRCRLTDLGQFVGEGGVHVESIIRLVDVLRPLTTVPNAATLIAAAQVTRELDDEYLPINRATLRNPNRVAARRGRLERHRWPYELAQQVDASVHNALALGASDGFAALARYKKAMACLLYASNTPLAALERHLTQHTTADAVAGAVRATARRTRDLMPAVVQVFNFLRPGLQIDSLADRIMVRLELGLPDELVDLGLVLGSALSRGQYLTLLDEGATAPGEFAKADPTALASKLGISAAAFAELQELAAQEGPLSTMAA